MHWIGSQLGGLRRETRDPCKSQHLFRISRYFQLSKNVKFLDNFFKARPALQVKVSWRYTLCTETLGPLLINIQTLRVLENNL
jgi:hypothetical protein